MAMAETNTTSSAASASTSSVCELHWLFLDYTPLSFQIWLERERWVVLSFVTYVKLAIFVNFCWWC